MTTHEHHTHPEDGRMYCCCGWGYPDPITSREPVDGLPTWEHINARDPERHPAAHSTRCYGSAGCVCPLGCVRP
jgi:hypothetical protein